MGLQFEVKGNRRSGGLDFLLGLFEPEHSHTEFAGNGGKTANFEAPVRTGNSSDLFRTALDNNSNSRNRLRSGTDDSNLDFSSQCQWKTAGTQQDGYHGETKARHARILIAIRTTRAPGRVVLQAAEKSQVFKIAVEPGEVPGSRHSLPPVTQTRSY